MPEPTNGQRGGWMDNKDHKVELRGLEGIKNASKIIGASVPKLKNRKSKLEEEKTWGSTETKKTEKALGAKLKITLRQNGGLRGQKLQTNRVNDGTKER